MAEYCKHNNGQNFDEQNEIGNADDRHCQKLAIEQQPLLQENSGEDEHEDERQNKKPDKPENPMPVRNHTIREQ